jgi:alanine dehydrogenase
MEMLYLSKHDVQNLGVTLGQVREAVKEGLRLQGLDKVQMPPKSVVRPVADSFLNAMPVYIEGLPVCGIKWMGGYRSNRDRGLPYISGLLILNDVETGVPVAVMDCAEITAIRTGAIVGIEAEHLARPDSSVVGILGCGVQARKSLIALVDVLPNLSLVRCYDIVHEAAEEFVAEMERSLPMTTFVICDSPADMAQFADVVVTATPIVDEPKPSLHEGDLKEGALLIALDLDASLSPSAMRQCDKTIVDDVEQFVSTKQEGAHLGEMSGEVYADLGDIVAGISPGRENPSERILCLNLGIAVADLVAANVLYDRALSHGIGVKVPL